LTLGTSSIRLTAHIAISCQIKSNSWQYCEVIQGRATRDNEWQQVNAQEKFPDGKYIDVPGLCKVALLSEIEAQGWSLNPGRYVGVTEREADDFDFKERLEELNEELEILNVEARELEGRIAQNVEKLLEA